MDVERVGRPRGEAEFGDGAGQLAHLLGDAGEDVVCHTARGQEAPGPLGAGRHFGICPGQARLQKPVADAPFLEGIEFDGQAVDGLVAAVGQIEPQTVAEERPDRVLHEPHQVVELEDRLVQRGKRFGEPGANWRLPGGGPRAGEVDAVVAPRLVAQRMTGPEVSGVERLQRVFDDDLLACRTFVGTPDGLVDDVEQLCDRHRRRADPIGAVVVSAVGDHQVLRGRQEGVEEELAILGAGVPVADPWRRQEEIVAVRLEPAGEGPVIKAQQGHDPVRHGAHGHKGANGQVAGAEVGPGGTALEATPQQLADLGEGQGRTVCC